jgi:dihydroorotate dehydrogenase
VIKLSNGHEMEYVAAAGALGWDGLGWAPHERFLVKIGIIKPAFFTAITKTITLLPVAGNGNFAFRFIKGGMVNAVALTNPGIVWWRDMFGKEANSQKVPLILSVFALKRVEISALLETIKNVKLVGLEFNSSCPNRESLTAAEIVRVCELIKENSQLPLLLKVSEAQKEIMPEICLHLTGVVEALDINSVRWSTIFPFKDSPLKHLNPNGGGVSGRAAQKINWDFAAYLSDLSALPVIWPSIYEKGDIPRARNRGARAFSCGCVFTRHPGRPARFIQRDLVERQIQQGKS